MAFRRSPVRSRSGPPVFSPALGAFPDKSRITPHRAVQSRAGALSQALAELVDVNPQTIGFLERGDYSPSVELALRLARVFNVPVDALFALDPFPVLTDHGGVRSPEKAS